MQAHARSFSTSEVLRMMKAFNTAATDLRGGWQPSLSLELALAEVLDAPNESPSLPTTPPSSSATLHTKPQPLPALASQPGASVDPAHNVPAPSRDDKPATDLQSSPPVGETGGESKSAQSDEDSGDEISATLEEETETAASHPKEKSVIGAGDIIKAWKHLTSSLPKSQANLAALLNSVKMIDVQGKTLILGLASDVLVSKIDKPDQIEAIQKLIKNELGVDMNIRCVVTTAKGKIPPNVPQDGMVAAAIQHGGQIVDM
jgi:DNA polymerase III gamma/tau subunit